MKPGGLGPGSERTKGSKVGSRIDDKRYTRAFRDHSSGLASANK